MNNPTHLAKRINDIAPFHVMALLARARALEAQGRSIIHMEIGEPDFATPAPIIAAGQKALQDGHTYYTPALGLPALREALSRFYQQRYNKHVDPRRIVITPGASGALQVLLSVLVNPGEQVLMADPGYPCNRHFVRMVEGHAIGIAVDETTNYQLTVELCKRYWQENTVAIMLASPANPTGTLLSDTTLQGILDFAGENHGVVIVDEIYHGLTYDKPATTALAFSDSVFIINSFSKYFGMTGWRLGWLVAPECYIDAIDKLTQNIFLAASTPAQYAALAALEEESIAIFEERKRAFKQRRDYLLPTLRELGFSIPITPQGAFYLYAGCDAFTDDSYTFVNTLLEEIGVVITPGIDFGQHQPKTHVRFAYTASLEKLKEGVKRLRTFLEASRV